MPVIDEDRMAANIQRTQAYCDAHGKAFRPHIKTHKSPELARLQIEAGARGITCQKLGEAEIMADGGIDDILISYNILGEEKLGRLGALQRRVRMIVAADNPVTISAFNLAAVCSSARRAASMGFAEAMASGSSARWAGPNPGSSGAPMIFARASTLGS